MSDLNCTRCEDLYPAPLLNDGICVTCQVQLDNATFLAQYKASDRETKLVRNESEEEIADRKRRHADRREKLNNQATRDKKRVPRTSRKARYLDKLEAEQHPEDEKADAVKAEVAGREMSRRFLLPFIQRFNPEYRAGWFHKDLTRRLEKFSQDVADGLSPRLMIEVPPRHGKSVTTTVNFPPWHLGHHPNHEFIICSYASQLAMTFSRGVREIIRDEAYQSLFPRTELKADTTSAEHWRTTKGGGLLAAGVGGPMTGNGAHILVIDDPVKNAQEAESETIREGHEQWYNSTAYTRLAPGGGVLFIMTRWHHDDLAGRLLKKMAEGGDQWEVVSYPAVAMEDEPYRRKGEALHPERYDEIALNRIQKAVGERTWWSLYQQQPTPDEGSYFMRDMLRMYKQGAAAGPEHPPLSELRIYTAWDFAIGQKERNDYTVGIVAGLDHLDRMFIIDMVRDRLDANGIVEQIIAVQKKYKPLLQGFEHGQIEMSIGPFLRKRQYEEKIYINEEILKTGRRDKEARARPIQGRMKQGMVFFPEDMWFSEPFVNELLTFPMGKHDDMVDSLAWLGQMFDDMVRYKYPAASRKETGWRDKLAQSGRLSRRSNRSSMSA